MRLYLDASALIKRYLEEPGSRLVETSMNDARVWLSSRIAYVEMFRALGRPELSRRLRSAFLAEWPVLQVVEVDPTVAHAAADLALAERLGSLDAIHLASALEIAADDLVFATWDRTLWLAAERRGFTMLPAQLDLPSRASRPSP